MHPKKHFFKRISIAFGILFCASFYAQDIRLINAFSKSYTLETNKDYTGAISVLKEVYDSTSYEVNIRLGWLNYKAGLVANSLDYYKKSMKLMPNSVEARLGFNYPAYAQLKADEIINHEKKTLELDPQNTTVSYNIASLLFNKGDYKGALVYIKKVIDLYPFDYSSLSLGAQICTKLNDKANAVIYLRKVLLYAPDDKNALEQVKLLGVDIKNDERIEKAFNESYTLAQKSDYKGAINALLPVYDTTLYEINLRLAYLYYVSGLQNKALAYYKVAIGINPKALEARFGIVFPVNLLKQTDDLKKQYTEILQIDKENSVANYRLGYIHFEAKDYKAANSYFEKVVKQYPFTYDGLLMLAKTNAMLGKKEDAKLLFKRVLLLAPTDKEALSALKI